MKYYYSKLISASYDDALRLVTEKLKAEGFGVISELKMHEKFKEKLSVDFKRYTILGACNPSFAYKALQLEDKIGVMLPCNVLVIDQGMGMVEIAAINPLESMQAVENTDLNDIAQSVSVSLKRVIENV
jgi:uncharacterized protein (DUF302 family)